VRAAAERIQRILYTSLGVAALVYTLIDVDEAARQVLDLWSPWALFGYLACALLPVALGALGSFAPLRLLWIVATAYCLAYATTLGIWIPLLQRGSEQLASAPWTYDVVTIAASAAAIAWRALAAWLYLGVLAAVTAAVSYLAAPEMGWSRAGEDALFALTFSVIVVSIIQVSKSAGASLDLAGRAAREEAAREARQSSAGAQRTRVNALIHDHVLSLLLAASRASGPSRDDLREVARSTLLALEPTDDGTDLAGEEVAARVRSAGAVAGADAAFAWDVVVAPGSCVPVDPAAALIEASAEAMRNSIQHAGDARRSVSLRIESGSVTISVRDDGRGFTLRRVAPDRLGVRVSIIDRMRAVGGRAVVDSAPGRGTEVRLCWQAADDR
jgi:signal transduction histidine kinase